MAKTESSEHFIPVNEPDLRGNELAYLKQCIQSGWISSDGPFVNRLENAFADYTERSYGIAVSSGSAALETAIAALGLGAGDEIILPTFTIISCASAVIRSGATPVLVDLSPGTLSMDVDQIRAKITPRTKAIMVVHIYGLPADMGQILEIADRNKLAIIEDAAEMLGQRYKDRPCGTFGDISLFSLYANKFVSAGEGGILLTNDEILAQRCRSYRNLCFQNDRRFVHEALGWNFRITNLQAAVALAQFERLAETVKRKREIGEAYNRLLMNTPDLNLPPDNCSYAKSIYWVYGLTLDNQFAYDAAFVMKELRRFGIGTRPFFWPMHKQPVFNRMGLFTDECFPISERFANRGFYIPNSSTISPKQMRRVAESIRLVLQKNKA